MLLRKVWLIHYLIDVLCFRGPFFLLHILCWTFLLPSALSFSLSHSILCLCDPRGFSYCMRCIYRDVHLRMFQLSRDSCWLSEQKYLLYNSIVPGTLSKKTGIRVTTWFSYVVKKLEVSNGRSVTGVDAFCLEEC